MANRFYIAASANQIWDASNTACWSTTSGGAGGASIPTASDAVIFDANSGSFQCSITTGICASITTTSYPGTLVWTNTSSTLSLLGSMTLTKVIGGAIGTLSFVPTTGSFTIASAGFLSNSNIVFGTGSNAITYTFSSAFSCQTVTIKNLCTIVTNGATCNFVNFNTNTGAVFSPATSPITVTGTFNPASGTFSSATSSTLNVVTGWNAALTLGTVNITPLVSTTVNIQQNCSYTNLHLVLNNLNVYLVDFFNTTQTVTSAFSMAGQAKYPRVRNVTMSVNGTVSGSAVLLSNFTAAGSANWFTSLQSQHVGNFQTGNDGPVSGSSITLDAGVSVNQIASGDWFSSSTWSNGWPPLPDDSVTLSPGLSLTNTSGNPIFIHDITYNGSGNYTATNLGPITLKAGLSTVNNPVPISNGNSGAFPDLVLGSPTTGSFGFGSGNGWIYLSLTVACISGATYINSNNFTVLGALTVNSGGISLSGSTVLLGSLVSTSGSVRTANLGVNTLKLTGSGTVLDMSSTNFTWNAPTVLTFAPTASPASVTLNGGNLTYNTLTLAGASITTFNINGNNTFANLNSTKAAAHSILFASGSSNTFAGWSAAGAASYLVTIGAQSGTFTLVKSGASVISLDYINVSNSNATPANKWSAGTNSIDGGGNTGWIFTGAGSGASKGLFFGAFI